MNPDINGETWLIGDIHGRHDILFSAITSNDIRNSNIILLGDVGVGFHVDDPPYLPREYRNLQKCAADRGNHLYLLRGNHDNPAFWEEPLISKAEEEYPNIHLMVQGYVTINNVLHYVLPGGVSIDKIRRTAGRSYWENEQVVFNPDDVDKDAFTILAHTGPRPAKLDNRILNYFGILDPEIIALVEKEQVTIDSAVNTLHPKYYFYGHFHVSWQDMDSTPRLRTLNDKGEMMKLDYGSDSL